MQRIIYLIQYKFAKRCNIMYFANRKTILTMQVNELK